MKTIAILILLPYFSLSATAQAGNDKMNSYQTAKIGQQEWMMTNLNISQFRNGDLIPQAKTAEDWYRASSSENPAWCYYNYDSANEKNYGKLYNWYAINDPRGLAPTGWHVPSESDWRILSANLGNETEIGIKMKSKQEWKSASSITNESNFTAVPSGGCRYDGIFYGLGSLCYLWSSTDNEMNLAFFRLLSSSDNELGEGYNGKGYGLAIRCIKD